MMMMMMMMMLHSVGIGYTECISDITGNLLFRRNITKTFKMKKSLW